MSSSFLRTTRVWGSIVSLSRRYLPAMSWKLVRFGFPGSYIANLVRSQDRRNDRFDRSWIFARCFAVIPSPAVSSRPTSFRCPFPFFFISTYVSVPLVFIGTNETLWRPATLPLSASSPLLLAIVVLRFLSGSDFISGRTWDNYPEIPRGLFRPRSYSPSSLNSADLRGYKFSLGNAWSACVLNMLFTRPLVSSTE